MATRHSLPRPLLVPLGALTTTVALVALIAGLATDVATSTVTGVGAGVLLARVRSNRPGRQPR